MVMNTRQRELLRRISQGERSYGRSKISDPDEGRTFDELVKQLQELQAYGWIELHLNANHLSRHGQWYAAAAIITSAGRNALG
jgi:hypothetical protein